jgi:hypothetical protein
LWGEKFQKLLKVFGHVPSFFTQKAETIGLHLTLDADLSQRPFDSGMIMPHSGGQDCEISEDYMIGWD